MTNRVLDRKFKRKMEDEPPTLAEEDSDRQLLTCKFCSKKFRNYQALGGHQNAHKRERHLINIEKGLHIKASGFGPQNVHPYPHSFPSMPNFPLQGIPFNHGSLIRPMTHVPNMYCTLAPPACGINQEFTLPPLRFGMTSSPQILNPQTGGFFYPIPSLVRSESNSLIGGSSSGVGLQGSLTASIKDSSSTDLDLSLHL